MSEATLADVEEEEEEEEEEEDEEEEEKGGEEEEDGSGGPGGRSVVGLPKKSLLNGLSSSIRISWPHCGDAEYARPVRYVRVWDLLLPPQIQYLSKTAEMEMIESTYLLHVQSPGLRSMHQRRQHDCLVHI
ncbi:hypothetical protein SprV_1002897500 [Sparganum proliferum]